MGWRGLDGVASPREGSRIMLGIYKRALKMQVGWQGLGGVAGSGWGASPREVNEHYNFVSKKKLDSIEKSKIT